MALTTTELTAIIETVLRDDLYAEVPAIRVNGSNRGNTLHAETCGMVNRQSYLINVAMIRSYVNGDASFYKVHSCVGDEQKADIQQAIQRGMRTRSAKMNEAREEALATAQAIRRRAQDEAETAYEDAIIAFSKQYGEVITDHVLDRLIDVAKVVDAARAAGRDI